MNKRPLMANMGRNDSRKPPHARKEVESHKGSHAPQNDSTAFCGASEANGDGATDNVIVPGMFLGYSERLVRRRSDRENNGINSGEGLNMDKLRDINGLDQMPDVQIVERKVYNGERVAHVYFHGPLARKVNAMGGHDDGSGLAVKLLSMDDVDTLETILEAEGYSVSRA